MSQTDLVLDHLVDHGYITPLIARNYGVERLAARIHDLLREGVQIRAATHRDMKGKRYTRYTLDAPHRFYEERLRKQQAA